MRGSILLLCGLVWLAGCATTRVSREPLPLSAQQELLLALAGFQLEGQASVQAGGEAVTPSVSWRQRGAESRFKFSGPLGMGTLVLEYGPQTLHLTTSRGEDLAGVEAEETLSAQLGFMPPFDALRFWVLGLPAPGEPPAEQATDAAGRILGMTQQQWRIHYDRWTDVATRAGAVHLPKRLVATRGELRLVLFVRRWELED